MRLLPTIDGAFEKSKDPASALLLARLMSDISEACCSAGWLIGNEFDIWKQLHNEPASHGHLTSTEIELILHLSERCGGWIVWREGDRGVLFVTLEEWEKIFNEARTR